MFLSLCFSLDGVAGLEKEGVLDFYVLSELFFQPCFWVRTPVLGGECCHELSVGPRGSVHLTSRCSLGGGGWRFCPQLC